MNGPEEDASRAHEDAAWQDIVAGYGDRPDFPDATAARGTPEPAEPTVETPVELAAATWEDEGHYVPPTPPPVPRPQGLRAVAWFGIFGVPGILLLLLLVHYSPPTPVPLLLVVWFVGGFGYLVATMNGPNDPDSGWDDGAVL